jgi:Response regulator containing CheY-like receiver, AAA-type ATPase, and DNA-binding domains
MTRVLVIDDEPDVLLLCRLNLEHAGHEVLQALSGELGLALAREQHPDVVILDLMMPMMDGYAVLAALKEDERTRDVPVVVLTAKVRLEDRIRSWQDGASEFVTKPFQPELLLNTLDEVVAMSSDERAERRDQVLRDLDLDLGHQVEA